jgi:hypothetical protein
MKILYLLLFLLAAGASPAQVVQGELFPKRLAPLPTQPAGSPRQQAPAPAKPSGKLPQKATTVVFTAAGQVSASPDMLHNYKPLPLPGSLPAGLVNTAALTTWSQQEVSRMRQDLYERFTKTAQKLGDAKSSQSAYYGWLWGQQAPERLAQQLTRLSKPLKDPVGYGRVPKPAGETDTTLAALERVLHDSFRTDSTYRDSALYKVSYVAKEREQVLTLRKKLILNDFLLTYFHAVSSQPANAVYDTLSRPGLAQLVKLARQQQTHSRALLARAEANRHNLTLPLLNELATAHLRGQNLGLRRLLAVPWLQQWLWYSAGTPRLNPLPFTDEELLKPRPVNDTAKAGYLRRYTRQTLTQRQKALKNFNIPSYLEDLNFLGKENTLFIDSAAYKQAVAHNRAAALKFQAAAQVVNTVRLPLAQPNLEYLSFSSTARDELAQVHKLGPLTTDTRVLVSVHNLERQHTLQLKRTQAALIKDQSATQAALDEGLTHWATIWPDFKAGAPAIAAHLTKYQLKSKEHTPNHLVPIRLPSTYFKSAAPTLAGSAAYFIEAPYVKSYNVVANDEDRFWGETKKLVALNLSNTLADSTYSRLLQALPASSSHVQPELWEQVCTDFKGAVQDAYRSGPSVTQRLTESRFNKLKQDISDAYLRLHLARHISPTLIALLRNDTLHLGTSLRLADSAALPPRQVKPRLDADPVWRTERAVTSLSDSTLSWVYVVQHIPPKTASQAEPVSFASFAYRTGKRHFVQFSAGLAYTFRPVRTPELTTTGGQLAYATTDTRFRALAGVHVYPFGGGVFLQDKHFMGLRPGTRWAFLSRVNVQLALGIPHPLDNVYLGLGYDLGPGIRICSGVHVHGYTAYEVANNRVLTQGNTYDALPYLSVGIDPVTFVKSLALFK